VAAHAENHSSPLAACAMEGRGEGGV